MSKDKNPLANASANTADRQDKKIEELELQCEEYKAGWMRAQADYQNLQKEVENRRSEWARMSEAQILEDFIPVYDHLKLAISNLPAIRLEASADWQAGEQLANKSDSWVEGVKLVLKQFAGILKNHGIEEIKTVGEMFNPELHEAVGEEEVEGKEAGEIVREVASGYRIGNKVLKVAKVILSKEKQLADK